MKEETKQSDFEILCRECYENALADTRAFGKNLPDCRNRYSDCRNTRKTIFPTRIKIHAVIGAVRAARNGDRRIPISPRGARTRCSIVYFRFARPADSGAENEIRDNLASKLPYNFVS